MTGAKPLRKVRLQPHDLVVVTRGGVGQVALIPLELPNPEEAILVVADTCSVIRLKQPSQFDARGMHDAIFIKTVEHSYLTFLPCSPG